MEIYATKDQIEELKSSVVWSDIVRELEFWRQGFTMEMSSIVDEAASTNPSTASVLLHLGDLNGRQKAVDYMLSILDTFLDIAKEKADDS